MRSKRRREEEIKTVLGKRNYVILIIGSILTIIGYILMSGEGSTLAPIIPIYLVEYAYVLPHYCVYWGIY